VLSHALREALGMKTLSANDTLNEEGQIGVEDDEPPYYARMRVFGYPPGYIKCE